MTVLSATEQRTPGTGLPEVMSFSDPSAGQHFTTTVPAGEAWRVSGASCHVAGSSAVANRTPCLALANGTTTLSTSWPASTIFYYVGSNGQDYNHDANQTCVFYDQEAFTEGPPWMTGAGETWGFTNNPPSLVYNPVGLAPIWLPAGTAITFYMHNIQAGDQLSQCRIYAERLTVAARPIDGLGSLQTFANPSAGANFTTSVPAGRRWRIQGGSALLTTTSFAISRFPSIELKSGNYTYWYGSQDHAATASGAYFATFHRASAFLTDLYVNQFVPVAVKDIWLPPATDIAIVFQNIQAGDQMSAVGLLVEDVPA